LAGEALAGLDGFPVGIGKGFTRRVTEAPRSTTEVYRIEQLLNFNALRLKAGPRRFVV